MATVNGELALEDLRKLTDTLHARVGDPDMVWPLRNNANVDAYRLHREPRVAVLRACVEEGSPFPRHIHGEKEVIIVYAGKMGWKLHERPPELVGPEGFDLTVEDMDGILGPGDTLEIDAGIPHSVMAIDGACWVIAVTVPASEAF